MVEMRVAGIALDAASRSPIVLLRDPVERTLSQLFHSRRLGFEPLDPEQALAAELERLEGAEDVLARPDGLHRSHQEHSYVSRSRYEQQLARWLRHVDRERMLLLRSEDLFLDPHRVWRQLQAFPHPRLVDARKEVLQIDVEYVSASDMKRRVVGY